MAGSDRVPLHPSRNTLHLHDRTARSCHLSLGRVQACAPWGGDSWPVFEMPGHCHVSVRKSLKHRGWALVWAIGSSRPPAPTCVAFGHEAVWDRQFILEPGSREGGRGGWASGLLHCCQILILISSRRSPPHLIGGASRPEKPANHLRTGRSGYSRLVGNRCCCRRRCCSLLACWLLAAAGGPHIFAPPTKHAPSEWDP